MKKSKMLWRIFKMTNIDKIIISFLGFVFLCALGIWFIEPNIKTYLDALWYCFVALTTIGFGDVVVVTLLGKIITVVLVIYAIVVIALIPGVVVAFYNESISMKKDESMLVFLDKLEHLPDLSKKELQELSDKVRARRYKL